MGASSSVDSRTSWIRGIQKPHFSQRTREVGHPLPSVSSSGRRGVTKVTIAIANDPRFPGSNLIESRRMSLFQRHRWFVAAAGITLAFAVVSLTAHKSDGLTAFADVGVLVLMLAA